MDTTKDPADRTHSDTSIHLSDPTHSYAPMQGEVSTSTLPRASSTAASTKGESQRQGTSVPVAADSSAPHTVVGSSETAGSSSLTDPIAAPLASSSSPSPSSPPRSPVSTDKTPTIKLTPATPDTTHFATNRVTLDSVTQGSVVSGSTKMASSTTPAAGASAPDITAQPAPRSTPTAGPSTTTAARAPTSTPTGPNAKGTKPRRKRTGFNKFLAAFGCLSAHDLEDDPATVAKREAAAKRREKEKEKEAVSVTPPSTGATGATGETKAAVDGKAVGGEREKAKEEDVGTGTGGTTLSDVTGGEKDLAGTGAAAQDGAAGEVVVPPSEPTSPPLAETAGLTSGAVQPPGSGAELLHQTPSKSSISMQRRDSEASVTASPLAASPTGTLVSAGAGAAAGAGVIAGTETLQHEESDRSADSQDGDDEGDDQDLDHMYQYQDEYEEEDRLIAQGGMGIPTDEYGTPAPLLPAIDKAHIGRKCLVLDLDETLLHSSFKALSTADYIVPVEIESQTHNVYVIKRPGVDKFLTEMGKIYEIVVFTASLSKYADPVLDMLDPAGVVKHRLFRESCYNHKGNYVKDLSQLGRAMETCIILDNSPASYIFHPNNAVPVSTWFNDPHDTELTDLCPFLTDLSEVDDIRGVLDGSL